MLFVLPGDQGRSLGRALLERANGAALARGVGWCPAIRAPSRSCPPKSSVTAVPTIERGGELAAFAYRRGERISDLTLGESAFGRTSGRFWS